MSWSVIATETLDCLSPTGVAASAAYELQPGESAMIGLVRTDAGQPITQIWAVDIHLSLDGITFSDVPTPRRVFGSLFLRPVFSQDSVGVRYFNVEVQNGLTVGQSNIVVVDLSVMTDGVVL